MKRLWVIILGAAVTVAAAAQPHGEGWGFARATMQFMKKLNLTEEQQKQVSDIRLNLQKQLVADRAKKQTADIELRQLLKADNPDRSAIERKLKEIADVDVQMRLKRLDGWYAVNKVLTPDQQKHWKKALELAPAMEQRHMGMQPPMGMRHRMGGPPSPPMDQK